MYYKRDFEHIKAENFEIGYPMTPGHWLVTEPTYQDIVAVVMTCGGARGGSQWTEYVHDTLLPALLEETDKQFFKVTTIDGDTKTINRNFIVSVTPLVLVSALYHSENPNYKKGNYSVQRLARDGVVARLVNRY